MCSYIHIYYDSYISITGTHIDHCPDLRLINHFHYPWSALCRGYAWSITYWYAWSIITLTYAWSIIFITPDQRCVGDTRDQSLLFTLEQPWRVISHVPVRLISHDAWSAWITYGYAWSVTFIYAWSAMTGDQPCTCTPDQPWRLISVNYIWIRVISHFYLLLNSHDGWSAMYLYAWSAMTPDQRKLHMDTRDQSLLFTPDQPWRVISHVPVRLISHDAWSA
jgi:hypothetical protein